MHKPDVNIPSYPAKDALSLYPVFILLIGIFYFTPIPVRYVTELALLTLFALSKKDYWWLTLFLLLQFSPWGLFSESTRNSQTGFPLLTLVPGVSFTFFQLFFLIALGKALYYRKPFRSLFKKQFIVLFLFLGYLIFQAILFGNNRGFIIDDLRYAVFWGLIYVFPALIENRRDTFRLVYLILPVVIPIFMDAVYFLITGGDYIGHIFSQYSDIRILSLEVEGISPDYNLRFIIPGWYGVLIGFILSLAISMLQRKHAALFILLAILAYATVIISATRSWFVIFGLIIMYVLVKARKFNIIGAVAGVSLLFFTLVLSKNQSSNAIFQGAVTRIFSVFDINKEGSLANRSIDQKVERRLPLQLEYIRQNPLTGWGFTEKRGDADVGIFGHLVEMGIVGVGIFGWLWYRYLTLTRAASKCRRYPKRYRRLFGVLWISFLGLLLSHFTTNQIFGVTYYIVPVTLLFWLTDFFIRDAKQEAIRHEPA